MSVLLRVVCAAVLVLAASAAPAQDAPVQVSDPPAMLSLWNRDVVELRATVKGVNPEERVARARERILALPALTDPAHVGSEEAEIGGVHGRAIFVRNAVVFFVFPQDLDPTSIETLDSAVAQTVSNLAAVLDARARQSRPQVLVRQVASVAGATVGLVAGIWLILAARRLLLRGLARLRGTGPSRPLTATLSGYLAALEVMAVRLVTSVVVLFLAYLWLAFVLSRFPYTAPWGSRLGHYLVDLLSSFAHATLEAIPGLFVVVVIVFIARAVARAVTRVLARVEVGSITIAWLDRETAKATRWVALTLIWLFAIVVAYPYIPGSDSLAFKGVSVFAGLMLTIGSSGFVGHILSGLIVVYSKALRTGEMVKVGDTMGTVSEVGAFSTRIVTGRGEEVNIPNSVLVGTATTNYSRLAGDRGPLLTTMVTIGYDAPWRQVHAMLELAAARTAGLRKEPRPYVLQRALSDFYVEYELRAHLERSDAWFTVQSELNARIQDAFNEYGVQIMSPHFMVQPDGAVVVPKSQWHAAPAGPAEPGSRQDAPAAT